MNNTALLELEKKFEAGDNKEYDVKAIIDSRMYDKEVNNQMPSLYYLILWKNYFEEENTWEPLVAVKHLWRLISTFHKKLPEKQIATSLPLDSAPLIAKPIVPKKQQLKQKHSHSSKRANKRGRDYHTKETRVIFVVPDMQLCLSWPQTYSGAFCGPIYRCYAPIF